MRSRGSIAQLLRGQRPGYILGEDGCMVAFDKSSLQGLDPRQLAVGDWVEYEELPPEEGRRAANIEPMIQRGED